MSECGAVVGVALAALDERVRRQLLAPRLAQRARPAALDDADLLQPGERSVVDEPAHLFPRLVTRKAADVELVRDVAAGGRTHLHHRHALLGDALPRGPEPCERDTHALPGR